jgi:hypothetical protein
MTSCIAPRESTSDRNVGCCNIAVNVSAEWERSSIVSNSGTMSSADSNAPPPLVRRTRPTSLRSTATSSTSLTDPAMEMT